LIEEREREREREREERERNKKGFIISPSIVNTSKPATLIVIFSPPLTKTLFLNRKHLPRVSNALLPSIHGVQFCQPLGPVGIGFGWNPVDDEKA